MDYVGQDLGPVLITGSAGYLGGTVRAMAEARGVRSVATSRNGTVGAACDLTDATAVAALLDELQPTRIIHCAANLPRSAAEYDDVRAAHESLAMTENLARFAPCPIVFVSSMTVYGSEPAHGVDERAGLAPAHAYARAKAAAEQVLARRSRPGDVVARVPGLFGLPRRSGVLYLAVTSFLRRQRFVLDTGAGPWAALAVRDAADGLLRIGTEPVMPGAPLEILNLGYPGEFVLSRAIARLARLCGVDWAVPEVEQTPFSMDVRRFEARHGALHVTFDERLSEFVQAVRHEMSESVA